MKDFITAALPWVMMGLALAVLAASYAREKKEDQKKRNELQLGGMALGMLLGVALGTTGLLESHALGISLGALWGLVIGTAVEPRDK